MTTDLFIASFLILALAAIAIVSLTTQRGSEEKKRQRSSLHSHSRTIIKGLVRAIRTSRKRNQKLGGVHALTTMHCTSPMFLNRCGKRLSKR